MAQQDSAGPTGGCRLSGQIAGVAATPAHCRAGSRIVQLVRSGGADLRVRSDGLRRLSVTATGSPETLYRDEAALNRVDNGPCDNLQPGTYHQPGQGSAQSL